MANVSTEEFWLSIWILLNNFHAVKRKIFACLINDVTRIESSEEDSKESIENVEKLSKSNKIELENALCTTIPSSGSFTVHQKLLTKKQEENINAIIKIDFKNKTYTCNFLESIFDDFLIKYTDGSITFTALTQRNEQESSDRWLEYVLKPKLLKWSQSGRENTPTKLSIKSLQLIDIEEYNELYKELKLKYSEQLKEYWIQANESTDPLKFIYEDLAIAAYLICLWRSKNAKPPTAFADLGCGNGLLVFVLNQEGYSGYGYDIRSRKLWSHYPAEVQLNLLEKAIVPDSFSPPNEVDWLIGNHSDELSPWLPVMAASGGYGMSYFLLPCCAFEFSGAKFQRRNAKLSTYQDFCAYAKELSSQAGFQTLEDRLKIPSTKRFTLVGCKRKYSVEEYEGEKLNLKEFVAKEMQQYPHFSNHKEDGQIKLREKNEAVRNCTKIDKEIIAGLVFRIFKLLLEAPKSQLNEDILWQGGGSLTMQKIAKSLTTQELKQIKAECGGIKTLLRNKHEVFQFLENDSICLRKPIKRSKLSDYVKRRPCYFDEHHPDGCPLSDLDCSFMHSRNKKMDDDEMKCR